MPRDLFGDVTDPSVRVASRKGYTVSLSLAAHASLVAVLLVVPLLAVDRLPVPDGITVWISPPPPPEPPPPPSPVRPPEPPPIEPSSAAAPVVPPSAITRETGIEPGLVNTGTGSDFGAIGSVVTGSDAPPPPPTPSPAREPIRPGVQIAAPKKIVDMTPVYPVIAQAARVQGLVIIEATIDVDGRVTGARVLRSILLLDQAALDAVRYWQYTPTRLNGVPVPVVMTVTVNFTLNRGQSAER